MTVALQVSQVSREPDKRVLLSTRPPSQPIQAQRIFSRSYISCTARFVRSRESKCGQREGSTNKEGRSKSNTKEV